MTRLRRLTFVALVHGCGDASVGATSHAAASSSDANTTSAATGTATTDASSSTTAGVGDDTTTAASESTTVASDESTGGSECTYAPPEGAIELRETDCAPRSAAITERLQCALALAAEAPVFDPPADPSGFGPSAMQGVVHIAFDDASPAYAGGNVLTFDSAVGHGSSFVDFPSNVRLEIDAGIVLAYGDPSVNGQLFAWDDVQNVAITRGSPCHGNGRFVVDLATHIDGLTDRARFLRLGDVDGFLLEHVHTLAAYSPDVGGAGEGNGSGAPVVLFRAAANGMAPRHGIYRHHSNQGSASGWGPNQIASLWDSVIEDIWTDGGDVIRFETSVGEVGSHGVSVDHVFGRNGFVAVAFTPHDASSSDIHVTDVNGVSMAIGVGAFGTGPAAGIGVFTDTTVEGGCIVAGDLAQTSGEGTMQSSAAVRIDVAEGADVQVNDIARSGTFSAPDPGGTPDARCDAEAAAAGFEDWWLELP